jgi:hypothetical protein
MTERRKTGRWRPDSVGKKMAGTNSMTIVIAARRDEEALLLADTMIGNRGERRNDVVPGRLKIVTIGPRVTVALAGNADSADVALRRNWSRSGDRRSQRGFSIKRDRLHRSLSFGAAEPN